MSADADRDQIARTVASIDPVDALEAQHRATVLAWIASGAEMYRIAPPDRPPMHLVSYFVPVDTADGSILLAAHRKSGLMLPPGGHCEAGELPWQTVRRECAEELAVAAVAPAWLTEQPLFVTVTNTQGTTVRQHTDVSLWHVIELKRSDTHLRPDPAEFDSVRWLSFEELLAEPIEHLDPHMHRFIRKLRAARTAPPPA
ncbi:MAG TPA: NUDIX domain-containing protein [Actinocrinis sp.]|nr:NUDIX domain-containing protein [Actinocrinis sp.]